MAQNYDLESLVKTFAKHHEKSSKDSTKILEDFKKNYPGEPIPSHMMDDFSLPNALHAICVEIMELKGK
jgi:hypothetical protein